MPCSESLGVFWAQYRVGSLDDTRNGKVRFTYDPEWLCTHAMPISLSLPCREQKFDADTSAAFFENMLPEEGMRAQLSNAYRLAEKDIFGFLKIFGRECAGALSILPAGEIPHADDTAYQDIGEDLARILKARNIPDSEKSNLLMATHARLSMAGAQDKLPVYYRDGRFFLPIHSAATSHLLKPDSYVYPDTVRNEFFCMCLAEALGLPVARHELLVYAGERLYMTERFDRLRTPQGIRRVHQEDFCQALACSNRHKYQEHGGPGFAECLNLVHSHDFIDRRNASLFFVRAAIFNVLVGNMDAHAKNYSILHTGPKPRLSPLYDLISTEVYPGLETKFSMAIGKTFVKDRLGADSWARFAQEMHMGTAALFAEMESMLAACKSVAPPLLAAHSQQFGPAGIYEKLANVLCKNGQALHSVRAHYAS